MSTDHDHLTSNPRTHWPIERVLFALAGTMTLVGVALAVMISPWFLIVTAFVGINQWLYVGVGDCPASLLLRRFGIAAPCSR